MPAPTTDIKALREKRAGIVTQAQEILKQENLTAEDEKRFDTMMADADALKARIDREERLLDLAADVEKPVDRRAGREQPGGEGGGRGQPGDGGPDEDAKKAYSKAFRNYLMYGAQQIDPEEARLLRYGYRAMPQEQRAQTTTTTGGGYLIPTDMLSRIDDARKEYGGVEPVATPLRTDTGNQVNWPTLDDTGNKATIVAENTQSSATDFVFGQKTLNAFMYRTMALVPLELLQDSMFDLDAMVSRQFGIRLQRGLNEHYTVGTGSGQPNGVVTASAAGVTASGNSTITFDNLVDLVHSLDPAYRKNARFMMHDTTLKLIKKLVDSQSRPLFLPGIALREPDTVNGYPYVINQDMAQVGPLTKSMLFGDFSFYIARTVTGSFMLLRLAERFADSGQVGFILFSRHDGELAAANATTLNPMKHLVHQSA